jgi:hypothetical protein
MLRPYLWCRLGDGFAKMGLVSLTEMGFSKSFFLAGKLFLSVLLRTSCADFGVVARYLASVLGGLSVGRHDGGLLRVICLLVYFQDLVVLRTSQR